MAYANSFRLEATDKFTEDLTYWKTVNKKTAQKVVALVEAVQADPFKGIGKPEPLLSLRNHWSRRITQEHRLVYRVDAGVVYLLQCRYHY
jgi:toxin YoeB